MKKTGKAIGTILMIFIALGLAEVAPAQQPIQISPGDLKVKKVEFIAQPTPNFQAAGVKNKNIPRPQEWLEVEVEFEAERGRNQKDAVVPELLFRYYIGFQNSAGAYVVLTGDVNHQNIVMGESYFSAVYVPPATLGKITGNYRRLDMGSIKGVGVEVFYNGVKVGQESSTKSPFWEAPTIARQPGVLSKDKTPFQLLWLDRYAEIKPTTGVGF